MLNLWTNKHRILPLLALLASTQACFDINDFNPERLAGVKVNPSVAIPLIHGSLAIEDLLPPEESPYIDYDEDQLIHILYSDTVYSSSIKELFLLPRLKLNKFYPIAFIPLGNQQSQQVFHTQETLDLGFSQARIDEINLNAGQLYLGVSSNMEADLELELNFPTLSKDGQTLTSTLSIPAGSSTEQTLRVDLQGFTVDFSEFGTGENIIPVDITATANTNNQDPLAKLAGNINLNLEIYQLDFNLLKGYLGQHEVQLPSSSISLTAFGSIFNKAEFNMKAPKLSIDFLNSNGIPIQVTTDLLQAGTHDGQSLPLDINPASPFNLNYPELPEEMVLTTLHINNGSEAFALAPDFIDYKLTGHLNTGEIENVNFLTNNSQVAAIVHADIPLWGYLKGLTLSDTVDFLLQVEDAQVQEITLTANIINEFPLGVDLQIYFLDEKGGLLDSLFDGSIPQLIRPSQVNQEGELSNPGVLNQDIHLSSERAENILKSRRTVTRGTIYTSTAADGSSPDVKIKANHRLTLNLGVKTNMNISVKSPNLETGL